MNPSNPDYYVISINSGLPTKLLGFTGILIVDRYNDIYLGFEGNIGKSFGSPSGSVTGSYIGSSLDDLFPDQANTQQFLSGLAINISAGALGEGGMSWSPNAGDYIRHIAWEIGAFIPSSVGISAVYSVKIPW